MKRLLFIAALSFLAIPLVSMAQTTVFQDTFSGGDSLNPTTAVTPTSTTTAYEIASGKVATTTSLTTGALKLGIASTSSGFVEAQAQFATVPITLSSLGQYAEIYVTFTDPGSFFNGNAANNNGICVGLFNSGATPLTDGANLWNAGLVSTETNLASGDAQDWVGFTGNIQYSSSATEVDTIDVRNAQTGTTNINQGLGDESGSGVLSSLGISGSSNEPTNPALTSGNQYTVALQIAYVDSTDDYFTESLLTGSGTGGSVIYSYGGLNAPGDVPSGYDSFDSLEVGYRDTEVPSAAQNLSINDITVIDGTTTVVPEPATYGLVVLTMLGAVFLRRRLRTSA